MSLTLEVRLRSKSVTTRFSISSGDRPGIDQSTLTIGNVDIREDIDGHGDDGGAAEDGDQNRHDDEGIGAAESQPDNPHSLFKDGAHGCNDLRPPQGDLRFGRRLET